MKVHEIMERSDSFLRKDDTLRSAAALFRANGVGGALVLDDHGFPETVFTSDDLIRALAGGASLADPVSSHAHGHMCAVRPDTPVSEIAWYENRFLAVLDGARVTGCVDASRALPSLDSELDPWACVLARFPEPLVLCEQNGFIRWRNNAARLVLGTEGCQARTLGNALAKAGFDLEYDPVEPTAVALAMRDDSRYVLLRWAVPDPNRAEGPACRMHYLRDVSDQHAVHGKLRNMREISDELRAIIDSSFDGIYITDGQGRTQYINRAYERITGIRAAEVIGRTMGELVDDGFYDQSVTLRVIKTRKSETLVQRVKGGKPIVVTGNPILDKTGNLWRVVTNVRDLTELQRLQEELEKMSALHDRYRLELATLRTSLGHGERVVVRSKRMRDVFEQALRLALVDSTVLISGESGVGKEVVAEVIHEHSPRREHPFVKISCAAIPETLLESELFGYVPGAFTGASRNGKPGVFELAHQGSLFLDEIGELPLGLQAKLLRALQERVVTRLGDVRATPVDVRIMAATNRDLDAMMREGRFRSDLYYRLSVVPIVVPPLRERREAIFDFIYRFLGHFNAKYGLGRQIDPDACDLLAAFDWPGNVRQLENTMERLVVLGQDDGITREDVRRVLPPAQTASEGPEQANGSLRALLERTEAAAIAQALTRHGSTRAAARALGVNQSTIVRKARRYGLAGE